MYAAELVISLEWKLGGISPYYGVNKREIKKSLEIYILISFMKKPSLLKQQEVFNLRGWLGKRTKNFNHFEIATHVT